MAKVDVPYLTSKINQEDSVGKQLWVAFIFLLNFFFVLTLTLNAIAFAWMGWILIVLQVLGLLLKLAGWRSIALTPGESNYLIKHPYRG